MDLVHAAALAKSGDCVLFLGAGFAKSSKNLLGKNLPTARQFANQLSAKLNVDADEYALETISDFAIRDSRPDGLGLHGLVGEFLSTFTVTETSSQQDVICAVPWKRVYTTNYDCSFEFSAKKVGRNWTSLTIETGPNANRDRCVHINGHVHDVNIGNFDRQIKLSHSSYAAGDFSRSPWASQLRSDIGLAPAVFFVGYSMADIDIARLLFEAPHLKQKTFFIVAENANPVELPKLEPYGQIEKIGLEGLANTFAQSLAIPKETSHTFSWLNKYERQTEVLGPTDEQSIRMLTLGDVRREQLAASLANPNFGYTIRRSAIDEVIAELNAGRNWFVIHSSLGNGKSVFKEQLAESLSILGFDVFLDSEFELGRKDDIRHLANKGSKSVVLVDEASSRLEAIKDLRAIDTSNITFVIFLRSAIFELDRGRFDEALPENFRIIDLNRLDKSELKEIRLLLDKLGLWGDMAALSFDKKDDYLRNKCSAEFANVILSLFENTEIGRKLTQVAEIAFRQKSSVAQLIILAFLMENADTAPRFSFVSEALGIDAWKLARSSEFSDASEFIYLRNSEIATRSSIVARHLLRTAIRPETLLESIAYFLERFEQIRKHDRRVDALFKEFQRFSFLEPLVRNAPRRRELLIGFYQNVKAIGSLSKNPLFWLQYAIARLSFEQYAEAEIYFKTAYSLARDGQPWLVRDIDNHYARLLLESRTKLDSYADFFWAFKEAHSKLFGQMLKGDNRHYPYRQAKNYVAFIVSRKKQLSDEEVKLFVSSCDQVLKNIELLPQELANSFAVQECMISIRRAVEIAKAK
jgi:SIR2-like domain